MSSNRRRVRVLAIGGAAVALGAVVVGLALAHAATPWLLLGLAIVSAGLLWMSAKLDLPTRSDRRISLLIGTPTLALGMLFIAWGFWHDAWVLALVGAAAAWFALPLIGKPVLGAPWNHPGRWIVAGILAGVVFVVLLLVRPVRNHFPLTLPLIAIAFVLLRVGAQAACDPQNDFGGREQVGARRCAWLGFGATLLGIILISIGIVLPNVAAAFLGVLFLLFGLVPWTLGWPRQGLRPITPTWAIAIGVGGLALGYALAPIGGPLAVRLVVLSLIAAWGASFVWLGEAVVVAVVLGIVLAWVLVAPVDRSPLDPNPDAQGRIVALGDSYISGEGSTMFFPGTNVVGQNECRRSSTAYPYLVASRLNMGLDFFACSGAVTSQVDSKNPKKGQMRNSPDTVAGKLPQLQDPVADMSKVKVVLISIGGNDAKFGEIGQTCLFPGSCAVFEEHWLWKVGRIGPSIRNTYLKIKQEFGDSVPVVAVPYPLLIRPTGCNWSALNEGEHAFLAEFVAVLDDRVRWAAAQAGVNFFRPALFAFNGHEICEGGPNDSYMNFFNMHPQDGSFLDRLNPANWVHGTFHPKPSGHEAIADILTPWLSGLLSDVAAGRLPANPPPDPTATFRIPRLIQVGTVLSEPPDLPDSVSCSTGDISPFATSLPLLNARSTFTLKVDPTAPICYTRPDGSWAEAGSDVLLSRNGNFAKLQPQEPDSRSVEMFLYRNTSDQVWHQEIVDFCDKRPSCPSDPVRWRNQQLRDGVRKTAPAALLAFVAAWFLCLGLHEAWRRRGAARAGREMPTPTQTPSSPP